MTAKPAYGSPCTNCGECCRRELCPLGQKVIGHLRGPCPAFAEGRGCGLIRDPAFWAPVKAVIYGDERLSKAAETLLGAGLGCDLEGPDERAPASMRARLLAKAERIAPSKVATARAMWGI